jgi:leader peptidase (prepilin peptidase)/N-methyltransferase
MQITINRLYLHYPDSLLIPPPALSKKRSCSFGITATLTGLLAAGMGTLPNIPALLNFSLNWCLLIIIITDIEQRLIFNQILLVTIIPVILSLLYYTTNPLPNILWGLGAGGLLLFIAIVTHGGIGGGDIKLLALLGLWQGKQIIFIFCFGTITAAIFAIIFLISGHKKRGSFMAYGPYFAVGAWLAMIAAYL